MDKVLVVGGGISGKGATKLLKTLTNLLTSFQKLKVKVILLKNVMLQTLVWKMSIH